MKLSPLQTAALAFYALPVDERPAGRPATATIKSLTARGLIEVVMHSRTSGEYGLTEAGRGTLHEERRLAVIREAVAREVAEETAPAVGTTVRFRSDFGAVGASGATFVVDTEPTVDNTRADRPTVVGLVTVDQARPGYRLAYVRDLVVVEGRAMPAAYAEPRKGTNAHVAWERGYAWSEWTKLPRSERMAETLRADGQEPTEQQLANLRLLDAPVADRLAAIRSAVTR